MSKDDKKSLSLKIIIILCIIIAIVIGTIMFTTKAKVNSVKIILSNGYEMNVITSHTKVSEILNENHIILLPEEQTMPKKDEELNQNKTIKITKNTDIQVVAKEEDALSQEEIMKGYNVVVDKIEKEQSAIPFETVTNDLTTGSGQTINTVVQDGEEGIKETEYKVKYENEVQVAKVESNSQVVKEPVNKVVEIKTQPVVTARSSFVRASTNPASSSSTSLAKSVEGITPYVATLNASAYTASTCDKAPGSSGYGVTASGVYATAWCTVAAGSGYKMGTVIYIPYFANMPNGGWFVVQDRGGAISNNRIDIYMDTYDECIQFGRRNLECYIYEF